MNMQEYQELAMRTSMKFSVYQEALASGAICLAGEVGEFCNKVKKHLWHGHALTDQDMREELGDILWYVATLAEHMGLTLEEIAQENIAKLQKRYPEGFDKERSKKR